MNGIHNGKSNNLEKPFPGCLGRMVNLFDLSTGVSGNRLLADKPYCDRDGSPFSRSRSDVATKNLVVNLIEDKVIMSELRTSNKKVNGTPVKTLIAQEMSKEIDSKRNPPSVVAKLMGLDALPQRKPDSVVQRSHSRGYSRSYSDVPLDYWQQKNGFLAAHMQHGVHQCPEQTEYRDVYEVWQQSQKANLLREKSPQKGRHNENMNEKKMALVRQKFIEAKRLATDEKLRQSKQFQDALEVLNSNKDLFLKFLQEPNSMFSQHLYNSQSQPPETKCITVLRPSKMMDNNKFAGSGKEGAKEAKKASHVDQVIGWDKSITDFPHPANWRVDNNPTQPTQIVVLKPSPGKPHDTEPVVSPPSSSPRILHGDEFYVEPADDEARESREVAKEITRQMRENLSGHQRNETLLSSVFSNGYIGDESSFNKSENHYAAGNLSDSEVMSPTSRHSWDYINRLGSPYSSSSFSHVSYSPESSVCREAKKRLSERWATISSNGSFQDQRHVRRSSSTLGEMLALSDTKNPVRSEEEKEGSNNKQESRGSTSRLISGLNKDESVDGSPENFVRSKSLPVSSTVYGARLNVQVSHSEFGKTDDPKKLTKTRSLKSSFKGKVSSLFFSRNKKSSKEKPKASQSKDKFQESCGMPVHSLVKLDDDTSKCVNNVGFEGGLSAGLHGSLSKMQSPDLIGMGLRHGIISHEVGLPEAKNVAPGNPSENQDQPSPISVLELPFEEDDNATTESSGNIKPDLRGPEMLAKPIKSNLIDKSPPIGSIARTLTWDGSGVETTASYPLKHSLASKGAEKEEHEWLFLVQTLLSAADLNGEVHSESLFTRWHSPESPLDPSLRDNYINLNNEVAMHENNRRQRRSTRKLVFDSVNAALVDLTGYGSDTSLRAILCGQVHNRLSEGASPITVDRVWARIKDWFSSEVRCVSGDGGDSNSLVLERVVRKEVVGKGLVEHVQLELDNIGKEIEAKLLEELVHEAVDELTGKT